MPTRRLAYIDLFIFLFALSAILGVIPAYDPSLSLPTLLVIGLGIVLYLALTRLVRSGRLAMAISVTLFVVTVAFALYFITQYDYMALPAKGSIIARLGQTTTLLSNLHGFTAPPNDAATALEIAVPLGVLLTVYAQTRRRKIVFAAGTLIVLYAIFLTASRGAWLALALTAGAGGVLTIGARLRRPAMRALMVIVILAVAAGVIVLVALGPDRLPLLASTFFRASDRLEIFENSLYLARDYAFTGIGLGNTFGMVYSRYSLLIQVPLLDHAHNLFLTTWLGQGLPGLVAWIGILVTFYRFVYSATRTGRLSPMFHGVWLGVTVQLLHGLTDAPPWVMAMWLGWLGLAAATGNLTLRAAAPERQASRRLPPRALAVGAIAVVITLGAVLYRPLLALWHTNLGALYETHAELAPDLKPEQRVEGYASAQSDYQNALAIDPAWPNANRRLGNLLVKLDQFEAAVPLLETAFAEESANPAAIKGLGLAYVWVGRTQDAARMFHLLIDPAGMANELYTWGNYRSEQKRPLLAAYAYETAQSMYPTTNLNVWLLIADTYRAADRTDAARLWYNRVLSVDPNNEHALNALSEIGQ